MSIPSCIIELNFYEASAYFSQNRFAYHCTSRPAGWNVQDDGSIHPPFHARIVQINLTGYPEPATFAGFQIAATPEQLPDKVTHPFSIASNLTTTVNPWPPEQITTSLTIDFSAQPGPQLFYRLAVQVGSGPRIWDDPKIYNDPGQ
jgi:hypothetical protein